MADAALFEFLHTEMVAELWAHDPDPSPGVSAGPWGWGEGEKRHGPRQEGQIEAAGGAGRTPARTCLA